MFEKMGRRKEDEKLDENYKKEEKSLKEKNMRTWRNKIVCSDNRKKENDGTSKK